MSLPPLPIEERVSPDAVSPPLGPERVLQSQRIAAAIAGQVLDLPGGRLTQLAERFGLAALDADVVAILWVGAFDPELRARLIGGEPTTGQITVRLIAALFGHPPRVRLASESALLLWQMVSEHPLIDGSAALSLDPAILAWLEGEHELDRCLAGRAQLLEQRELPIAWPVEALARRVQEGLRRGQRWRLHLISEDPLAARWCAAAFGAECGLLVMAVPSGALRAEPDAAVRLQRQAFLDGCVPCLALEDAALSQPCGVLPFPIQILHGRGAPLEVAPELHDLVCELPGPDVEERERLWRALWPECAAWPAQELADLALCHEAGVADIAAVAASAPASAGQAAEALRDRLRGELNPLVHRIDGRFVWSDLVLPPATETRLREIAFEARERARVWADPAAARLFPYGRGLVALFAGPPGTGKTMAAQVIAADLGLDLLAVDLSAVISKWVGETAQHLQELLSSRAAQRSVLFFDEADALYAKRVEEVRDAQDRFANVDTSHLMTALEAYPGIVLLASNLKGNIDSAFLRRIRHVVEFARPDAAARAEIWRRTLTGLFGATTCAALASDITRLAQLEASGAQIKTSALSSVFAARRARQQPNLTLLAQMLSRELAKEGAGLSTRDLAALTEGVP